MWNVHIRSHREKGLAARLARHFRDRKPKQNISQFFLDSQVVHSDPATEFVLSSWPSLLSVGSPCSFFLAQPRRRDHPASASGLLGRFAALFSLFFRRSRRVALDAGDAGCSSCTASPRAAVQKELRGAWRPASLALRGRQVLLDTFGHLET